MTDVMMENQRERELDEELTDVLIAISVISKRLARKLTELQQTEKKGENRNYAD